MLAALRSLWFGRRPRRIVFALGSAAVVAVGAWSLRGIFVHRASAQPAPVAETASTQQAVVTTAAATTSDYGNRVVAYVFGNQPITRQDLGEYLVCRFGAEKLPVLLNKRILDKALRERGIVVTSAEVDATLAQDLKGLAMDQSKFIKDVLGKYKKTLYEWQEDVLRPRLQMTRLVQNNVVVTPEEIQKAFDTAYGEKVECRIIFWPLDQERKALDEYGKPARQRERVCREGQESGSLRSVRDGRQDQSHRSQHDGKGSGRGGVQTPPRRGHHADQDAAGHCHAQMR